MKHIFQTSFFQKFTPPNKDELINRINTVIDRKEPENVGWDADCLVDVIPLRWEDWIHDLEPSLDVFSKDLSYDGGFMIHHPWINLYEKNGFQEVHIHDEDMASVFFLNDGPNFGELYFFDRMNGILPKSIEKLINYYPNIFPKVEAGDMIMFPGSLLHGVSAHRSDTIRKTFSFNFTLTFDYA